jgi:hypothetical protein
VVEVPGGERMSGSGAVASTRPTPPVGVRPVSGRVPADLLDGTPPEQRLRSWAEVPHPSWGHAPAWAPRPQDAGWWWLGVHGGAGVSTLDAWMPGGADAHRLWPDPQVVGPSLVLLVARTHVAGLTQAMWALRQAAAADVPAGLRVAGVVAVSDGPGGFGRPQEEALRRLQGVTPHLWLIPWIDELRLVTHSAELGPPHPSVLALFHDLAELVDAAGQHATDPRR